MKIRYALMSGLCGVLLAGGCSTPDDHANKLFVEASQLVRQAQDVEKTSYARALALYQQAQEKLLKYQWPGNVRELQHTIEKAVILSENAVLKADDFFMRPVVARENGDPVQKLEEMEKRMILLAIEKNNGNFSIAAEQLGITRQTLYNKVKKFGI